MERGWYAELRKTQQLREGKAWSIWKRSSLRNRKEPRSTPWNGFPASGSQACHHSFQRHLPKTQTYSWPDFLTPHLKPWVVFSSVQSKIWTPYQHCQCSPQLSPAAPPTHPTCRDSSAVILHIFLMRLFCLVYVLFFLTIGLLRVDLPSRTSADPTFSERSKQIPEVWVNMPVPYNPTEQADVLKKHQNNKIILSSGYKIHFFHDSKIRIWKRFRVFFHIHPEIVS